MKQSKPGATPGPWTFCGSPDHPRIVGPDGMITATITAYNTDLNGTLVAAAPELLAALEAILCSLTCACSLDAFDCPRCKISVKQARAAIRRARSGR